MERYDVSFQTRQLSSAEPIVIKTECKIENFTAYDDLTMRDNYLTAASNLGQQQPMLPFSADFLSSSSFGQIQRSTAFFGPSSVSQPSRAKASHHHSDSASDGPQSQSLLGSFSSSQFDSSQLRSSPLSSQREWSHSPAGDDGSQDFSASPRLKKSDNRCLWSDAQAKFMLDEYGKRLAKFNDINCKNKGRLWPEIAGAINSQFGTQFTSAQVSNKFKFLKKAWKAARDRNFNNTGDEPHTSKHYDWFELTFGHNPIAEPIALSSASPNQHRRRQQKRRTESTFESMSDDESDILQPASVDSSDQLSPASDTSIVDRNRVTSGEEVTIPGGPSSSKYLKRAFAPSTQLDKAIAFLRESDTAVTQRQDRQARFFEKIAVRHEKQEQLMEKLVSIHERNAEKLGNFMDAFLKCFEKIADKMP